MPQRDEAEHVLGSLLHRWTALPCTQSGASERSRSFYRLAALLLSKELSSSVITPRIPS
jgi:hypothetical protein